MQFISRMSARERVIFFTTVAASLIAGLYLAYFQGFLENYGRVSRELEDSRRQLEAQRKIIEKGSGVDQRFALIGGVLPQPTEGRRPEAVFSEDLESMFRTLGFRTPEFGRSKLANIPEMTGFAYLILPIERVRGTLNEITVILKSFANRNLVVQNLSIKKTVGKLDDTTLAMSVDVAQFIQTETTRKDAAKAE
jgi:hypothetical protein